MKGVSSNNIVDKQAVAWSYKAHLSTTSHFLRQALASMKKDASQKSFGHTRSCSSLRGEPYALKGARTVRKGVHYTGFLPY